MKPYANPIPGGPAPDLLAVGRRLSSLLKSLHTDVTSDAIAGEIVAHVETLRDRIIKRLMADGWRIAKKSTNSGWWVLPPHAKPKTKGIKKVA